MAWFYTATTFLSALLLFWVQPTFAKMVLPRLGGSPSVWNTATVSFQAALSVGWRATRGTSTSCRTAPAVDFAFPAGPAYRTRRTAMCSRPRGRYLLIGFQVDRTPDPWRRWRAQAGLGISINGLVTNLCVLSIVS